MWKAQQMYLRTNRRSKKKEEKKSWQSLKFHKAYAMEAESAYNAKGHFLVWTPLLFAFLING